MKQNFKKGYIVYDQDSRRVCGHKNLGTTAVERALKSYTYMSSKGNNRVKMNSLMSLTLV